MATEDILIRYRADVSQLESDLNKLIQAQEDLTKATADNTKTQQKALTSAEFAARKRAELIEVEKAKLIKLKEALKLAFDPKDIEKFNRQITESQNRIELLAGGAKKSAGEISQAFNEVKSSINTIAGAFGVALSVESIVQFTKAAVNAFLDAENAALALRNAIVDVGGDTEAAYERLITQSRILQQTTIFGDDDIQNAQAILSTFGLTAAQIEELTPKLADLAKPLRTDIVGAAEKVGAALQGAGKAFKQLGIDVSASKTEIENLNAIIEGSVRFQGQAEAATKSLSGQLQQLQNDANNAQEEIGSKFASAWANFTAGAFKAINAILGFNQAIQDKVDAANLKKINDQLDYATTLEKKYGRQIIDTNQILEDRTKALEDQQIKALLLNASLKAQLDEEKKGITATIVGRSYQTIQLEKQIAANDEILRQTQVQIDYINGINDKKKEEAEQSARTLKADELRTKNTQQLNELLVKQLERYDIIGQANERLIQAEIERRKKAEEEYKKQLQAFKAFIDGIDAEIAKVKADLAKRKIEILPATTFDEQRKRLEGLADLNEKAIADEIAAKIKAVKADEKLTEVQKQQIIKKYNELKNARLEFARFNEANELNILSKAQLDRINKVYEDLDKLDLESILTVSKEKVETANEAVVKSFEDLSKAINKQDFAAAKEAATLRTNELNLAVEEEAKAQKQILENELQTRNASLSNDAAGNIEREKNKAETDAKILAIDKEKNKQIAENNQNLTDTLNAQTESYVARWVQANQEILRETVNIVNEINGLFRQSTDERIKNIEEQRDAQLAAIDAEIEKNKEYFEDRRISEEQLLASEDALAKERVKIEEETRKKINAQKRKQAQLDKAAAIFEIGINTAIALTNPAVILNPILATLVATTALLQTAAVLAQPIPYRKGSKDTGAKGHMARVGEEGEELVYMPSNSKVLPAKQTRKYGDIIDAMFDNKLDQYIQRNYITPALMAQQNAKEGQRTKTFAENIANSITYNQTGLTASDLEAQRKRGQYIRNVDELADAIAKRIPTRDIYRA